MSSLSVEVQTGQYVKLQEARTGLDVKDNLDDEEITTMLKDANQDMEVTITPFIDTLPVAEGTNIFKALSRAGLLYVKARWKEKKHNFELSNTYNKLYALKMKEIVKALKSIPENRTKALLVSSDPRDKKLPIPTQYDIFVFDDFA